MKWNKVSRLPLKKRGQLVKWAEGENLELVRVEGEYKFLKENGNEAIYVPCRCSYCMHVEVLVRALATSQCSECEKRGEA